MDSKTGTDQAEYFFSPFAFSGASPQSGLVKQLVTQKGQKVPRILAEAAMTLTDSGPLREHVETYWNKKSRMQKWAASQDVLTGFIKQEGELIVGKNAFSKMLTKLLVRLSQLDVLETRDQISQRLDSIQEPISIQTFAMTTASRPVALKRGLSSYLSNFKQFQREPRILVSDDGQQDAVSENQEVLNQIRNEFGVSIEHLTHSGRQELIDGIADSTKKEAMKFLLFGDTTLGATYGANRNAIHFLTKGQKVFSADDDTIASTYLTSNYRPGIAFSGTEHQDYKHFANRNEAKKTLVALEKDIIHEFSQVGENLHSLLAAHTKNSSSVLKGLDQSCWSEVLDHQSRVLMAMGGLVGDNGSGASYSYLFANDEEEKRIFASPQHFSILSKSREIVKSSDHIRLSHKGPFMTTFFSYDNRLDLFPFFPNFRMEDELFRLLNLTLVPCSKIAYLPLILEHSPIEQRVYENFIAPVRVGASNCEILEAILSISVGKFNPLMGHSIGDRKRIVLNACLRFADQPIESFRRQVSDFLLAGKYSEVTVHWKKFKDRRKKIPKDAAALIGAALSETEKRLCEPILLCDPLILKIEEDGAKAELLQKNLIRKYFESCLAISE